MFETQSTWDEGAIAAFLNTPTVRACAIDLRCGGHLLCFLQASDMPALAGIASNVDALLRWMGVPSGFTVLLVWRDDPRRIAADEWPSRRTVNGGWTTQGSNAIVVYRAEEYDRVILHEIIHAMNWDWNMPARPLACWGLGDNARLTPHLFEAWTELYAEWLWCVWNGVDWAEQMAWSTEQAVQICARADGPWREITSVFAYYVLKAALAPHIGFLCAMQDGGRTAEERAFLLCTLAAPQLAAIRAAAQTATPRPLSLRMSKGAAATP